MKRDHTTQDSCAMTNGGNGEFTAGNGRDPTTGRFVKGCRPGPGNPHVRSLSRTRAGFVQAVTMADFRRVVESLFDAAERGEAWAIKEVLNRTCGKV